MEHVDFSRDQKTNLIEMESSGGESEHHYYMVQGNDSLEVHSDTQLDSASFSFDDINSMDADTLNEELSIVLRTS